MHQFARILFWLAVAATLFATLRPLLVTVPGSDKTHHAITFGVLMLLAACAYPRVRVAILAVALSAFGGLIELIQPYFGRSDEVRDWVADTIGILIVVVAVAIWKAWRGRASTQGR